MTDDIPPFSEAHPDKMFIWLDENNVRCGPRHKGIKAAFDYARNWTPLPALVEHEDDLRGIDMPSGERSKYKRMFQYPSQKAPAKLRIGEWIVREPTHEEGLKIEAARRLIDEGII